MSGPLKDMKEHLMNTPTHTHTLSKLAFLSVSQNLFEVGSSPLKIDSFNKNISWSTLIIHCLTATGAIKWCSSVNESTICSTYLFVKTMLKCSPYHVSSPPPVTSPLLLTMCCVVSWWSYHSFLQTGAHRHQCYLCSFHFINS